MYSKYIHTFSTLGGVIPGLSAARMLVNSSEKLETSVSLAIFGMKGAGMFFLSRSSQAMARKNLWALTSSASAGPPPSRRRGSWNQEKMLHKV